MTDREVVEALRDRWAYYYRPSKDSQYTDETAISPDKLADIIERLLNDVDRLTKENAVNKALANVCRTAQDERDKANAIAKQMEGSITQITLERENLRNALLEAKDQIGRLCCSLQEQLEKREAEKSSFKPPHNFVGEEPVEHGCPFD